MSKYLTTTTRTVTWFKKANDAQELQMKPPFQRNPVWVTPQKQYLIDSIINGFPIPEIYMQEYVDENGKEKHIIIDGQQRIRSCLEFIEGRFQLDPEQTPTYRNMLFDNLPAEVKKAIYGYTFQVRVLPEMPDDEIRGIFQRLNKNVVALNPQELRQATYSGKFIKIVQEISDYPFWTTSGIFTPRETRRMLDIEFVSELSIAVLNGLQNKKETLDDFYSLYEEGFDQDEDLVEYFQMVLFEIEQIFPSLKNIRFKKKTDFYSLFYYLSTKRAYLPLPSDKITTVRQKLIAFSENVNKLVSTGDEEIVQDQISISYSKALRASSDLGNRKRRNKSLADLLDSIITTRRDEATLLHPQSKDELFKESEVDSEE